MLLIQRIKKKILLSVFSQFHPERCSKACPLLRSSPLFKMAILHDKNSYLSLISSPQTASHGPLLLICRVAVFMWLSTHCVSNRFTVKAVSVECLSQSQSRGLADGFALVLKLLGEHTVWWPQQPIFFKCFNSHWIPATIFKLQDSSKNIWDSYCTLNVWDSYFMLCCTFVAQDSDF